MKKQMAILNLGGALTKSGIRCLSADNVAIVYLGFHIFIYIFVADMISNITTHIYG